MILFFVILYVVNNYEISYWQYKYLCVWKRDRTNPYIPISDFLEFLGFGESKVFLDYFKNDGMNNSYYFIIDHHVSLDNLIPFLTIFAFFSLDTKIRSIFCIYIYCI